MKIIHLLPFFLLVSSIAGISNVDWKSDEDFSSSEDDLLVGGASVGNLQLSNDNAERLTNGVFDLYRILSSNNDRLNQIMSNVKQTVAKDTYSVSHVFKHIKNDNYYVEIDTDKYNFAISIIRMPISNHMHVPGTTTQPGPVQGGKTTTQPPPPVQGGKTTTIPPPETTQPPVQGGKTTTTQLPGTTTQPPVQGGKTTTQPGTTQPPVQGKITTTQLPGTTQLPVQGKTTTTQLPGTTQLPVQGKTTTTQLPGTTTQPPVQGGKTTNQPGTTQPPVQGKTTQPPGTTQPPVQGKTTTTQPPGTTQPPVQGGKTTTQPGTTSASQQEIDKLRKIEDKRFNQLLGQWMYAGIKNTPLSSDYNFMACDMITIFRHGSAFYYKILENMGNSTYEMRDRHIDSVDKKHSLFKMEGHVYSYKLNQLEGKKYKVKVLEIVNLNNSTDFSLFTEQVVDTTVLQSVFYDHYPNMNIKRIQQVCE